MKFLMRILLSVMLLLIPANALAATASSNYRNSPTTVHHPAPPTSHFGVASWYGPEMCLRSGPKGKGHYRKMADGDTFDPTKLTAASRTLPFGTEVLVTNIRTGLSVVVRITDRGPYAHNRILDLAEAAAQKINCNGVCYVRLDWDMPEIQPTTVSGPTEIVLEDIQ
jgi:rare lipoprotein A